MERTAVRVIGSARLLAGLDRVDRVDLAMHRELHGAYPTGTKAELERLTSAVGLRGRGGAGFPVARKLAALPSRVHAVVLNGSESEPASLKDRALLTGVPHLVLDGATAVATAVGARRVVIAVHDPAAAVSLRAALAERQDLPRAEVERPGVIEAPNGGTARRRVAIGRSYARCRVARRVPRPLVTGRPGPRSGVPATRRTRSSESPDGDRGGDRAGAGAGDVCAGGGVPGRGLAGGGVGGAVRSVRVRATGDRGRPARLLRGEQSDAARHLGFVGGRGACAHPDDWTRCDGHGLRATLLPEQITLDDWGFPVIADGDGDSLDGDRRRAVLGCPALALRLEGSR